MNKKIIVGIIIAVVVVVAVFVGVKIFRGTNGGNDNGGDGGLGQNSAEQQAQQSPDAFRPGDMNALPTVEGGSRENLTENITVPEVGATSTDSNVAVPVNVIAPLNETGGSFRQFTIKGEGGKYVPSIIIANELDVLDITFEAVDADYNVFFPDFGVFKTFAKGTSGKIQMQAYPFGQYKFYCKDVCDGEVEGKLIVNKK